jgi:hypothetical protein
VLTAHRLRVGAFVLGLAVSAALVALAQAGGDQLNLLARGWLLAAHGELVPYGNPLSSGGNAPGALSSVLVGWPLAVWSDHRAPIVLIWVLHLAAWLVLDRTLRGALTPVERAALAVVYWLNPWRVEAAGFLWNPNYLPLVGAAHLATARALAARPRFGATFVHVLALGLGAQLHPSVLLLGVLSALLWARGYVRVSWPGFAAGCAATAATLAPWLAAVAARPDLAAASGAGFPFRGLLLVQPMLKGLSYWLRYPSLALHRESARLDFSPRLGEATDGWLAPAAGVLLAVAGVATLAFALWANLAFFRARRRSPLARPRPEEGEGGWLDGYVALALVAAVATFAASPTTPQAWQMMPFLHVAVLPVVRGVGRLAPRLGEARLVKGLAAGAALALAADLALAAGAPNFRCGGRYGVVIPLRASSPMFEEIGLQRTCPWPLDRPGGWWPDVLPEHPK